MEGGKEGRKKKQRSGDVEKIITKQGGDKEQTESPVGEEGGKQLEGRMVRRKCELRMMELQGLALERKKMMRSSGCQDASRRSY